MKIKKGARGNEVVDVQQRLLALGYDLGPIPVDGFFEHHTATAVKRFQADCDLKASGIVDEITWRRMVDATFRPGARVLYLRSPFFHGDDVRQLQRWLNGLGFKTDHVDGIFGSSTEQAVREFQDNVGITADGIVGPTTHEAFGNLKSVLDQNEASLLVEQVPADSLVALLADRKIAIGCQTPLKRDWLAPDGNPHLICADLAHRLSNLLEILGATVDFVKENGQRKIDAEVAVFFTPNRSAAQTLLDLTYDHGDDQSRLLGRLVSKAISDSLEKRIGRATESDGPGYGVPAIQVAMGNLNELASSENDQREVLRQKIAGAIFDGLKEYFETPHS